MPVDLYTKDTGLDITAPVAGVDLYAPDPNAPGPFKRGLKTGISDLKSIGGGIMQYAGRATGWGALEKKGEEIGQAAATESAPYRMQVEDVGKAFDQGIIPGLKSSADLLAYTIGNQIPMMGTAIAGGVLGRVAAGAFGATRAMAGLSTAEKAAAVARTAAGTGSATDVAVVRAARMADLGIQLGVGASSTAMELGQIAPEGLKPENKAPLTQMALGSLISGATDTIVPVYLARKLGLIGAAERVLTPRTAGFGAIAKGMAETGLKAGAFEAGQEGLQTYIERASANQKLTGPEANSEALNSTVMGGIIGLVTGTITGGFHARARPVVAPVQPPAPSKEREQPPVVNTPEEQHAAATQQMATFEAGVTEARAAQQVASARLAELTAERKLDFKERRPYPEIDAERKTVQEQARKAKETAKTLEDQWHVAKATVTALAPQVSAPVETTGLAETPPASLAGDLQAQYVTASQAALAADEKVATIDAAVAEKGGKATKELADQRAAAVKEQKAARDAVDQLAAQSYTLRQQVAETVPETPLPELSTVAERTATVPEAGPIPDTSRVVPSVVEGAARTDQPLPVIIGGQAVSAEQAPQEAVKAVHAIFRSQEMPLTTTRESFATPPLAPREVALQKVEQRTPREAVKNDTTAQMAAIEDHAMAVIEPMAMELAKTKGTTAEGQKKVAAALTKVMRGVVQEAQKQGTVEAAQAYITEKLPNALKGRGVMIDAPEIAKAISAVVGQAKTVYSRGAIQQAQANSLAVVQRLRSQGLDREAILAHPEYQQAKTQETVVVQQDAQEMVAAETARTSLDGFENTFAPAQRAKAVAALTGEQHNVNGTFQTRRDFIRVAVAEGARVGIAEGGRALVYSDGRYMRQKDITKTALDYAEFLQSNPRESRAGLTQDEFDNIPEPAKFAAVDEWNRIQMQYGTEIRNELRRMLGDDPNLVVKTFQATPDSPVGSYTRVDKWKAVIAAALNASDRMSLAAHEGFHYAEDRLLTDKERIIVANAMKADRPMMIALVERAQRYDRENKTHITDEITGRPAEARAYAFQFWRLGELKAEGPVARAFQIIRDFFEKVSNLVNGLGFTSIDSIFMALDRGQFAERGGREQYGLEQTEMPYVSTASESKWYRSALTAAVQALPTKAASAEGWKQQIKGLVGKNDVKQVEIDAVGLNEFLDLQKGKVTKDQVVSFLRENGVRVQETVLGGTIPKEARDAIKAWLEGPGKAPDYAEFVDQMDSGDAETIGTLEQIGVPYELLLPVYNSINGGATKFDRPDLVLPGGTNYRELLLTLPYAISLPTGVEIKPSPDSTGDMGWGTFVDGKEVDFHETKDAAERAAVSRYGNAVAAFNSSHFDQPNILAHIRFDERTDAEGKRVLFIEEIQSDWAAKGRKEGFAGRKVDPAIVDEWLREKGGPVGRTGDMWHFRALGADHPVQFARSREDALAAQRKYAEDSLEGLAIKGVPSAPFVAKREFAVFKDGKELERTNKKGEKFTERYDTQEKAQAAAKSFGGEVRDLGYGENTEAWVRLSLVRMIRYAAENGYDSVAWTTGAQQVARYEDSLRKVVDRIEWTKTKDGVHIVGYKGGPRTEPFLNQAIRENAHSAIEANEFFGFDNLSEATAALYASRGDWATRWHTETSQQQTDIETYLQARQMDARNYRTKAVDTTEKESAVSDAIGKAMADKIKSDPAQSGVIEGADLTVSDTGMSGFYDRIVPSVANEVLRKLGGGRVEEIKIGQKIVKVPGSETNRRLMLLEEVANDDAATVARVGKQAQLVQPGFALTPALIQKVEAGVPLFSRAASIDESVLDSLTPAQRTLYSNAAIATTDEYNRRAAGGELADLQVQKTAATMIENARNRGGPENILAHALGLSKKEPIGSMQRWWFKNIATPNLVSRYSTGFRNVMQTLNTYIRYRKILVEQMLREKLPSWYKASEEDRRAAFGVMLKRTVERYGRDSKELAALYDPLTEPQKKLFNEATGMIAGFLNAEFAADRIKYKEWYTSPGAYEKWEADRGAWVADMIDKGYVPLKRYGDHTVYVFTTDAKGKRISAAYEFFDSVEHANRVATAYEEEIKRSGVNLQVEVGMRHKNMRETGISIEQFLGNLERNGVPIQQAAKERLVEALTSADSRVRNQMMHRTGLPGYSEDSMRVLHEFGVGTASKLAYSKFGAAIDAAAQGAQVTADVDYISSIPKITIGKTYGVDEAGVRNNLWERDGSMSGFYHGVANELSNYVLVPDHTGGWSRRLRAAAMVYFIGGSISGAMVNTMSIPMMLVPELSVYTNYTNGLTTAMTAWKDAWRYYHILRDTAKMRDPNTVIPGIDQNLRQAILAASDTIFDTEIHQMLGMSQGTVYSKSRNVQKAMEVWMSPFRISEQTNRLTSFIAAYRVASTDPNFKQIDLTTGQLTGKTGTLQGQELFKFAHHIVDSTQNSYSESNRPGAARNPIFALAFMFKSFPLFMIEAAHLMYKASPAAARNMLLGLVLLTGIQGLPFAETIENLIDTIAQNLFGSAFNTKRAMINITKQASEAMVGVDLSELVMWGGLNAIAGVSASSRIGAGDFVPGTRLGTADADQGKILAQFAGAPYAMIRDVGANIGGLLTTDWKQAADALRAGGPIALRNLIKGSEQVYDGYASDSRGRMITDVSTLDGLLQMTGLSSAKVAKLYQYENINLQTKAFYNQVSADMQDALVKAIKAGDTEKVQEISDLCAKWNAEYPGMPIMPNAAAVRRAIVLSGLPLDRRSQMLWSRRIRGENVFSETEQ